MELVNLTRYAVERVVGMDGDGRETLTVAVKATFSLLPRTLAPALAEDQPALVMADEYLGEPGVSSLACASEMVPYKPAADVILTGCAYAPREADTETMVTLRLPPLQKTVRVVGDRVWEGWRDAPSRPRPLSKVPLVYERAFGGSDATSEPPDACPENPVGVGFRGKRSRRPIPGTALPNLEDPRQPISGPDDRPPPRCFGPIAPGWSPRPTHAGTYDARWKRDRMPLLPVDFDPRFHHVVASDQVLPGYISGGELVTITCVRPGGDGFHFAIPVVRPSVVVRVGTDRHTPRVHCDTLSIDCEAERMSLVFRATLPVAGRVPDLAWIKVEEPNDGP